MKRTTKIFIGMFFSGLIVIIVGILALLIFGEKRDRRGISLNGEQVEMEIGKVRAVRVSIRQDEANKHRRIFVNGGMTVTSSPVEGKGKISYAKNEYLNVVQRDDTLLVEFALNAHIPEQQQNEWLFLEDFNMNLALDDATLNSIVTDANNMKLTIRDIKTDSLFVWGSQQEVLLDSCEFRSFGIDGYGFNFHAKDSKIENYYLYMNGVRNWTFENSEIGTEFLFAHGQHSSDLQKGECRRIVWNPCSEDARLDISIREKTEIEIDNGKLGVAFD